MINQAGKDLIKQFEGLHLKAYPDPATGGKPWTIGYGHTKFVEPWMRISRGKAEDFLDDDIRHFSSGVRELIPVKLTDNQFAALVSFSFNCGLGNLERSTLRKKILAGDFDGAALEFLKCR